MIEVQSTAPSAPLRPFVRGYAQRITAIRKQEVCEQVPARLEPTLEFELVDPFRVEFADGSHLITPPVGVIGPQTHLRANVRLTGRIECFAIFFQPTGFKRLFGVPLPLLLDDAFDASCVIGGEVRTLRDRLGECRSFAARVNVVEKALYSRAMNAGAIGVVADVAQHIFARLGTTNLAALARGTHMSFRNFERRFRFEIGLGPKRFSRIARFQTALDAKLASPQKTWREIAHHFEYHDQMHMVRDFNSLGGGSPGRVLALLGDMRPEALTREQTANDFGTVYENRIDSALLQVRGEG